MEIISGEQNAGPKYIPRLTIEGASQLFTKLYSRKVDRVKALAGYDSQNFYIHTVSADGDDNSPKEYVLKILTYQLDNIEEVTDIAIKTMLYLRDCDIVCSEPLRTADGNYLTRETVRCCQVQEPSKKHEEECITQSKSFFLFSLLYRFMQFAVGLYILRQTFR